MNSIDKLREWAQTVAASSPDENIVSPEFVAHECARKALLHADEIEREIERGYMELPLDADGVPIRVGDVMEFSAFEIEKPVTRMVDGIGQGVFFAWCGERGYQQHEAKSYRHHHEPTIEDVLRDMVAAYMDTPLDDSNDGEFFAEYAAKLRLAGDAE